MRDKLIKDVKKRFGPVFGSKELKELRGELIQSALDHYDEEIAKGAQEKDAYAAASDSLGNMEELLESVGVPQKRRARGLAIAVPLTAVLVLLSFIPFYMSRSLLGFIFSIPLLVPSALICFGMISLACGKGKKASRIACIAIGGSILGVELLYCAFIGFWIVVTLIGSLRSNKYVFDYTKDLENIKSVEIVELENTAKYETDLKYRVICEVAPESWESLLSSVASLEYTEPFIIKPKLKRGDRLILIRFKEPEDGIPFVFIGRRCPGFAESSDPKVRLITHPYSCKEEDFAWILKTYGAE